MTKYDLVVLIGRFQPIHEGHKFLFKTALDMADRLLVLVGSANCFPSVKNPFSYEHRKDMIFHTLINMDVTEELPVSGRVTIEPLNDHPYNDTAWVRDVNAAIRRHGGKNVGIIGYNKDASSYYLTYFPTIEFIDIGMQYGTINATQLREQFFQRAPIISEYLPPPVREWLKEFSLGPDFKNLLGEFEANRAYRKLWENTPFPPIFVTVDCVVVQSGNVLLVKRGEYPAKGALALPGGFIGENELLIDAAVRELKEETRISDAKGEIPPAMLKSFIKKSKIFDAPDRSTRGRTITNAFLFELPMKPELFGVRGDDDAEHAHWVDISTVDPKGLMEDHWFIIQDMLGIS